MLDADMLYTILSDDSVWPTTGFPAKPTREQVCQLVSRVSVVHFLDQCGFVALVRHADNPTVADVHSGFLPSVRGAKALRFCRYIAQTCEFKRLETWCEPEHKAARAFAKMVGFHEEGNKLVLTKE